MVSVYPSGSTILLLAHGCRPSVVAVDSRRRSGRDALLHVVAANGCPVDGHGATFFTFEVNFFQAL